MVTRRNATDPRDDLETAAYWDGLTAQLRVAVHALDVPDPVKAALIDTIDLHNSWEHREQIFDPGYSHDVVLGIGCRSCDHLPQPNRVALECRPCGTVRALQAALLPADGERAAVPDSSQVQRKAWSEGWSARVLWEQSDRTGLPGNPY